MGNDRHIGVDFDNTIICYDPLFLRIAKEKGLADDTLAPKKRTIRDFLRRSGKEEEWTELQGCVYGSRIVEACPFPGVLEFFRFCRQKQVMVSIISHKTRIPYRGPGFDLHQAADLWLESQGFFDPASGGLRHGQVYFELTRIAKMARIAEAGCTHFIDDLPEFLLDPSFPRGVERILFDPDADSGPDPPGLRSASSWQQILEVFSG